MNDTPNAIQPTGSVFSRQTDGSGFALLIIPSHRSRQIVKGGLEELGLLHPKKGIGRFILKLAYLLTNSIQPLGISGQESDDSSG